MKDVNLSGFSQGGIMKTYIMLQDVYMLENGTVPGYVFLIDGKECKIGHLTRMKVSLWKFYADYIQVYFHIFYLITDNQMRII
jgi:hypothetical protein